jgi:hypothetical protein
LNIKNVFRKFVGLFVNKIAQKGMHYAEPDVRFERIPDVPQLKWYLEGLSGEGFEYALIAHSGDSDFHDELKYGERKTEMVIQGVRVQVRIPSIDRTGIWDF